jgi:peptidoglycan/LPS O-acetylase OafA/YrhL
MGYHSAVRKRTPLPALTGARFLAAVSVVFFHYGSASLPRPLAILANAGPTAVSFFYVLSGAVLTWGCTRDDGLPANARRKFWGQRGARVLPAYYLALGLTLLPFAAQAFKLHDRMGAALRIGGGLAACGLLLQAFWPPVAAGLNTPGWSISCEAFFYSIWPGAVGKLRVKRAGFPLLQLQLLWTASLIVPLAGIALLRGGLLPGGRFASLTLDVGADELLCRLLAYFPPLRLPEFLIGIALGHALLATPQRPRSTASDTLREAALVCATVACAWVLGNGVPGKVFDFPLADRVVTEGGALSPLFAVWVWQLARGSGLLARLFSQESFQLLGEASYALYVLQEPLVIYVTAALKRLAPTLAWSKVFWGYLALLIVFSLAVHRFWETPLRARFRRGSSPPR